MCKLIAMKIYLLNTFFILTIVFTISCKNDNDLDFERTIITINNQKFEILTAWKIFDDYRDNKSDYENSVFLKIKNEFNDNMEFPFLLDAIKNKIKPDDELKNEIELMKNIDFVSIVDSVFQIVANKLPGPDTKILFIPANPANREFYREFGVGFHAFTLGTGKIIVSFDPTFENWIQHIYYALAHEYHHSVWTSRNFKTADLTPLEYIILEGKADLFAKEIFPKSHNPFWDMLDSENEKRIWDLIKPIMNQRNTKTNDRIYYGTRDIPFGSVYAIGFNILKSFKKNNPEINDAELIDKPPEEVLYLSKYDE
jgi:uncharacterized protein YjaZ